MLKSLQFATDIPRVGLVHRIVSTGVSLARAAEDTLCFRCPIRLPYVFNVEHRQHDPFPITKSHLAAAGLQILSEFLSDIQRDRHRPEDSACQAHVLTDTFV